MEVVGVIPAAGYASRLQPIAGSKEVLAVNGRPAMDHLVERMRLAPCTGLRVVTRPEKVDVVEHAASLGAEVVQGHPATLAESLRLGIEGLAPTTIVLFGFTDSMWTPVDGFARLRQTLESRAAGVVVGLFETPHPERCEIVSVGLDGTLAGILFKPSHPPSNVMWGCFAARASELAGLERFAEPGLFLDDLCRTRAVQTVRLGEYLDFGTREALDVARSRPW